MVCEWGMSDAMGPLTFGKKEEQIFLGREIAQHQDYSEDTAVKIDQEVKRIVTENYERSREILLRAEGRARSRSPTQLLAREVLDADQVRRLAAGLSLDEAPVTVSAARAGGHGRGRRAAAQGTGADHRPGAAAAQAAAGRTDTLPRKPYDASALANGRVPSPLGARTLVMGILNVTPDSFADYASLGRRGRRRGPRAAHGGRGRRHHRHRRRIDPSRRRARRRRRGTTAGAPGRRTRWPAA